MTPPDYNRQLKSQTFIDAETIKALMIAAWYLEKIGEDVAASNIRWRIFGYDPVNFNLIKEEQNRIKTDNEKVKP